MIPPVRRGEPIRAATINHIIREIDGARRLSLGPGMAGSWTGAGLALWLARAERVDYLTVREVHATGEHPDVPGAYLPSKVRYTLDADAGYTLSMAMPDWRCTRDDDSYIRPARVGSNALLFRFRDVEGEPRPVLVCPDEVEARAECPEFPP